jgi:4-amino-4-deoxy-L-arabinose transferase-like glycosyltransferase
MRGRGDRRLEYAAVCALSLIAGAVYLVGAGGCVNPYYAATVHSMLMNPHALAYASFDPIGFVSIDKPPLGLWLQAASAAILGFSGAALALPSAIAALACLLLLWRAVRATAGPWAGVGAAVLLAMTPVVVVIARDNNLDGIMTALCLASVSATLLAIRTGRSSPLLLAGLLLGLAFNVKMAVALMVLPGIVIAYGLCSPNGWRHKLATGGAAALVLVVASMAWLTFVAITPASQRPYVGGTQTNSPFELAVSGNGLNRMFEEASAAKAGASKPNATARPDSTSKSHRSDAPAPVALASIDGPGDPGPLRLFDPEVGGQIGWFMPLALVGLLAELLSVPWRSFRSRPRGPIGVNHAATILWGAWLAAGMACLSFAYLMEPFYVVAIAPPVAALAAIGTRRLVVAYRAGSRTGLLLPMAIMATAAEQFVVLGGAPDWLPWLAPLELALASIVTLTLLGALAWTWRRQAPATAGPNPAARMWPRVERLVLAGLLIALTAGPVTAWSLDSLRSSNEGPHPFAGPTRTGNQDAGLTTAPHKLVEYLLDHAGKDNYLVATLNESEATPIELSTNRAVMALGGFAGNDPILTPDAFARRVSAGDVRFVLLPSAKVSIKLLYRLYPHARRLPRQETASRLSSWVLAHCQAVPPPDWSGATRYGRIVEPDQLFDCGTP